MFRKANGILSFETVIVIVQQLMIHKKKSHIPESPSIVIS